MRSVFESVFIVLFLVFGLIFIDNTNAQSSATSSAQIDIQQKSFEIFWPLVSGKTMDQQFYYFKDLREKLRGMFIFGQPQKADYAVLLATKRFLEVVQLMEAGKTDLVDQTIDNFNTQLNKADKALSLAKENKEPFGGAGTNIMKRLNNIEQFTNILLQTESNYKDQLQDLLVKVQKLKDLLQ